MGVGDDLLNGASETASRVLGGEATLEDFAKVELTTKALASAFGLLGTAGDKAASNIKDLSEAVYELYERSKTETAAMSAFSHMAKGEFGAAIKDVTTLFKGAYTNAQEFQKTLVQYGQDKSFQKAIGEQARDLATLGISYDSLKKANLELVDSYNAAIRITETQSKSFEDNRKAMSQLLVFNDKFGIGLRATSDLLNFTKNTMGGGTEAAIRFSEQLERFAKSTGQNTNAVFTAFNTNLDRFSVQTADKAIASFERLQMTAARTGQSMSGLIDIVGKFDDIDSGFEKGGQINRVLSFMGGSFDTFKAFQAEDEERAKMIYEAIAGVADKYSELNTTQAKRNFAKQLQESTGVDLKTVVGLLNKSTDLSRDIADISKRPLITEGYTPRERADKMVDLSLSKDFAEARDGLLEAGKAAQTFAEKVKISDRSRTDSAIKLTRLLDEKFLSPIVSGNTAALKSSFEAFGKSVGTTLKEVLSDPDSAMSRGGAAMAELSKVLSGTGLKLSVDYKIGGRVVDTAAGALTSTNPPARRL